MPKEKIKAVGLLSGGLDSTLAVKLMLEQGIDVIALKFTSPFCLCNQKGKCNASEAAKAFNIPLKVIPKGADYLKIVRKPKFGYGSGMNPCIDCRIFILKKAKQYAKQIGAKFIFTGEVLGQRPMSQHRKALDVIEKEAGLSGKLVRPLSAKLLPETEAEKHGWIDRNKLLAISGRSRKPQISITKKFGITDYPCPSGGCLLTCREFAAKINDLFKHKKIISQKDIQQLKVGRHFRLNKNKLIVGRNKDENERLLKLKNASDYILEVPDCGSPITILQGEKSNAAIKLAAELTAAYSDTTNKKVTVRYGKTKPGKNIIIHYKNKDTFGKYRV